MQSSLSNRVIILIFILLPLSVVSCKQDSRKDQSEKIQTDIKSYWMNYSFTDQQLIENPELIKAPTLSFLNLLDGYSKPTSVKALKLFMDKLLVSDTSVLKFTVDEVLDKYLYRADSPIRNEEYYLTIVDCLINSQRISDVNKMKFEFQKKMISLNQVGSIAMNFDFITKEGRTTELYGIEALYTLIYFHHPDCDECKKMKRLMQGSPLLSRLLQNKQLVILAVFTDNDKSLWQNTALPRQWINSYNTDQSVVQKNLYDLRAIPCLYLLNRDKRVIIKDGLLTEILSMIEK